jgi:hypothetical protein
MRLSKIKSFEKLDYYLDTIPRKIDCIWEKLDGRLIDETTNLVYANVLSEISHSEKIMDLRFMSDVISSEVKYKYDLLED